MKTLRNLTLHPQQDREIALAREYGYILFPEPEGVSVGPGHDGLATASELLAAQITQCAAAGHAALIGGHTGVWIAAVLAVVASGARLPELCYFETERVRDDNGRFIFVPRSIVSLLPNHASHFAQNLAGPPSAEPPGGSTPSIPHSRDSSSPG